MHFSQKFQPTLMYTLKVQMRVFWTVPVISTRASLSVTSLPNRSVRLPGSRTQKEEEIEELGGVKAGHQKLDMHEQEKAKRGERE